MSYNILYFFKENSISLLIGIFSANLVGSIGYVIWLFLQRGTAKFYVSRGISYLKIILGSFILPLFMVIPLWCVFQVLKADWVGIGVTTPMKWGIFLLVFIWLIATIVILIYRYISYWHVRYLSLMNVPLEDKEILNMVDKWKTRLNIEKKVTVFYNETMTSPALVYYDGYKILLPVYEMEKSELNIALLHELMHLKNEDIFTKNVGFVINAMHSFNPLTYAIRQEIGKWEEVNCDLCCCEEGKDEFTQNEYYHCIINLKERCGDVSQPDIMCCLFEVKDLLKFRIDAAQHVQEHKGKHNNRNLVITAVLVLILTLFSFQVVTNAVSYCYNKTIAYKEDHGEDGGLEFQEATKEEWFAKAKVSYYDGDILDNPEGTKFALEAGEIMVFALSGEYRGGLSVMIASNGNSYQFGFVENIEMIRYIDRECDGCIRIDKEDMKENSLYVKNMGKEKCQMELVIIEN